MPLVDDSGLEVLRKAAIVVTSSEYKLRTDASFDSAEINIRAPTGPFAITVATATSTAANPLSTPLTSRVSLSIRNKSTTVTIYFGKDNTVTADNASTGGWEIGPGEDFNIDIDDTTAFYLITPAATTALVKIFEIAST
jgi:hypothetical protein